MNGQDSVGGADNHPPTNGPDSVGGEDIHPFHQQNLLGGNVTNPPHQLIPLGARIQPFPLRTQSDAFVREMDIPPDEISFGGSLIVSPSRKKIWTASIEYAIL